MNSQPPCCLSVRTSRGPPHWWPPCCCWAPAGQRAARRAQAGPRRLAARGAARGRPAAIVSEDRAYHVVVTEAGLRPTATRVRGPKLSLPRPPPAGGLSQADPGLIQVALEPQPDGGCGGDVMPRHRPSSAGPSCSEDQHGLQVHRSGLNPWAWRRRSACGEEAKMVLYKPMRSCRPLVGLRTIPPSRGSRVPADRPRSPCGPHGCVAAWGSDSDQTCLHLISRGGLRWTSGRHTTFSRSRSPRS